MGTGTRVRQCADWNRMHIKGEYENVGNLELGKNKLLYLFYFNCSQCFFFNLCVQTFLPEVPTKFYAVTLKQRVKGTKMHADICMVSVLIVLDFSAPASLWTGSVVPFLRMSNIKEKSEVRLKRKFPKSLNQNPRSLFLCQRSVICRHNFIYSAQILRISSLF